MMGREDDCSSKGFLEKTSAGMLRTRSYKDTPTLQSRQWAVAPVLLRSGCPGRACWVHLHGCAGGQGNGWGSSKGTLGRRCWLSRSFCHSEWRR